nr:MAG: hypothetical protein 3 [Leviviridae sp.]
MSMKSQVNGLLHIASNVLKDIQAAYPSMKGLDLDQKRLAQLVEDRGLGLFGLDLPSRDDQLLAGLESGLLDSKGTLVYSKSYPVPRLFAGLYMRIFDKSLRLKQDADVTSIAFLRQMLCLGKKVEIPCSKRRELDAIKEFCYVEKSLQPPSLAWDADTLCSSDDINLHLWDILIPNSDDRLLPDKEGNDSNETRLVLERCQRLADTVANLLGNFCPDCYLSSRQEEREKLGLSHGPGAVSDKNRDGDKYHFTSWSEKLGGIFPFERFGTMPSNPHKPVSREVPSKLISVPKTMKGPRLIAAESASHMWCQKLTASWIRERIESTFLGDFINLKRQDLSASLVTQASLDRKLATIDLSSASDRLSCKVVERIFRKNVSLLRALHAARTRWTYIPLTGEYVRLNKFATQGTDVTFPIQSLVFLIIVLSVCSDGDFSERGLKKLRGQVRVYGDDIIVPTARYDECAKILSLLQLKVNLRKSFALGHFRESCGMDSYKGYDVTPIKPKVAHSDGPAAMQALVDTSNNLFYKGYWHAATELEVRLLSSLPPNRRKMAKVGRAAGASGFGSFSLGTAATRIHRIATDTVARYRGVTDPCSFFMEQYQELLRIYRSLGFRIRWNAQLSRFEVRCETLRSRSKIRPYDRGYSGLLHYAVLPSREGNLAERGIAGVPDRPRLSNQARWEPLLNLF